MESALPEYETLGQFYLGRELDAETREPGELFLYDSKDLVTHGVVLGMTGSGKTGLCLAVLEEAAMDDIPALVIDPKGDIANLLLMFPDLDAASFRPWVQEEDAAKKGLTVEEHAGRVAETWRKGLEASGQDAGRIRRLLEKTDINIFTPGSRAGIPLNILGSLEAPPFEVMDDPELLGERIDSTVRSLLALAGVEGDPMQSPEAVLLGAIFQDAWARGLALSLESLIRHIQQPAFDKVGVIDLETFSPAKARQALALRFNNLLASPGFATWLEGPPLDVGALMHTPAGKPRISIVSIAHLGEPERMFVVSLLLNQTLAWMRSRSGTTTLRALLYMDEIFGYLPPSANPPSKRPMMTLLKQARAYGLGCLLATQNPVDLDYKALSNTGTWFLGRLQTERDKLRVLDGLQAAAAGSGQGFDRATLDRLLSGLGNRVFLMNNVHESRPVLFSVRWVMSYLTGPLTRTQIKGLMDPKRGAFAAGGAVARPAAGTGVPAAFTEAAPVRPVVGAGGEEWFVPVAGAGTGLTYRPHVLRQGRVRFVSAKAGLDQAREVREVHPVLAGGVDWEAAVEGLPARIEAGGGPAEGAGFAELPGYAMNAAFVRKVSKDFADALYQNERAEVFFCPALKAWSRAGESEAEFRARLVHQAHEARDAAILKIREALEKKSSVLLGRMRGAEGQLAKRKAAANASKMQAGISVLAGILGGVFGRKVGVGTLTRGSASIGKATTAYKQSQDVSESAARVEQMAAELERLRGEHEREIESIRAAHAADALVIEAERVAPRRSDVQVVGVVLVWLPYDAGGRPAW